MRASLVAAVAVSAWLYGASPSQAGLYNMAEPQNGPRVVANGVKPLGFTHFREVLATLLNVGLEAPSNSLRKHYLMQRDELLTKNRGGALSTQDQVNLSEYLIRLRQYEEAVQILTPVAARERRNFMVFANLATAHQLAGRLDRALAYLEQVRDVWPQDWPGLSEEQLAWYREAETYHLKLVGLRYRETLRQQRGRPRTPETLDELFAGDKGGVHFVGESGRYEAGKLAVQERAKLPEDALAIVQQLLIWLPGSAPGLEDTRLYWQLGELYNAEGDVSAALQIFERCQWTHRFDAADLREHRRVVQEEVKAQAVATVEPLSTVSSGGTPLAEDRAWKLNPRQIAVVGGVAAVLVAGLIYLQIREIARRRRSSGKGSPI